MAAPMRDVGYDEEPVIAAIRMGDRHAFAEFVQRNEGWVRSVIFSVLGRGSHVDDVAQNVWTAAWQRIGELRDAGSWRTWLYRMARNAALDAVRERTRRSRHQEAASSQVVLGGREGEADALAAEERRRAVLAAIESLPEIYREPLVLRHMNDWNCRQIAEVLGLPADTVETRLVRARRLLRGVLGMGVEKSDVAGE